MSIIFNGKEYAEKKRELIRAGINRVREQGVVPHLVTIIIGDNTASKLYVNLKKKFIESLGAQVDIYSLSKNINFLDLELLIKTLNQDDTVHGIMVQFPLPESLEDKREQIIELISGNKDVDGLKSNSKYLHPTSKAVLEILALAIYETKKEVKSVCVVGSTGMVGRPLVQELKKMKFEVVECDKETKNLAERTVLADALISATGKANLIGLEMVKNDAIVIDVGSPFGDVSPLVEVVTSFITPVPGGVGPVTITCLAENLIVSAQSTITSNSDVK